MSTNKRKESAALFELLDKSTLKVPKSGGSLKIPSWWSSKTNPAPAAAPPPADVPEMPAPAQKAGGGVNGAGGANGVAASPQHRLFDPPPANAPAGVSPSIRPPAVTPPVNPPVNAGQAAVRPVVRAPEAAPRGTMVPEEASEESPTPRAGATESGRRVFAPQTYDPNAAARRKWMGSQKRMMARTPPWAVLTAGGAVLALLILIVVLFVRHHQQTSTAGAADASGIDLRHASGSSSFAQDRGSSQPLVPPSPANGGSLLPPVTPQRTQILQQNTGADSGEQAMDASDTPGKVYAPGTVERDPQLLYVYIASTPQADVAQRNADFIAKNGVDVSIETSKSPSGKSTMYTLISVKGFPTHNAAEPYRKRIVLIGHKTPDFQKTHKAWDDAYVQHVKSLVRQTK